MKRYTRLLAPVAGAALLALALVVLFTVIHDSGGADEALAAAGSGIGESVGFFKGSVEGIPYYREEYDQGKEQGLEAGDTSVTGTSGEVELGTGKLQVMAATVSLIVDNQVSDKYAALALLRGNMVFTVDLGKAVIEGNTITLPELEHEFSINNSESELIAEYQKKYFGTAIEDGYTEYLNSVEKIRDNVSEFVEDYDELYERARASAVEQVSMIAGNVSGKNYTVLLGEEAS